MTVSLGKVSMDAAPTSAAGLELSIVMPCLNEAETLARCIGKAKHALELHGIDGEIIVADNGSTDGSPQIATAAGARVVHVSERGYGSALMGGISAARGRFVIMGDADDSYDFGEIPTILGKLRAGYGLVQGCRLPWGGGRIMPGAMPPLHRWFGNPLFTVMARLWFRSPVQDIYCGLRGFSRELYDKLELRCTGMEFATEMIIKASMHGERIADVPVTLHKDGRRTHPPHLRTFRDGWRTLRFLMLYSPRWVLAYPGMVLVALGLLGYGVALPGLTIGSVTFDAHTLLFSSLALICGYQALLLGVVAKTFALSERLHPDMHGRLGSMIGLFRLERGLGAALVALLIGTALLARAVLHWSSMGFGELDYALTMRWVIPGVTLITVAAQTAFSSFVIGILGLHRL